MVRDEMIRILKNLPVGLPVYKIGYEMVCIEGGRKFGKTADQMPLPKFITGVKISDGNPLDLDTIDKMVVKFEGENIIKFVSYEDLTCDAIIVADKLSPDAIIVADKLSPDKLQWFETGVREELVDLNLMRKK